MCIFVSYNTQNSHINMEKVTVLPPEKLINGWIDPKYLPEGKDKYYIRN